MGDALDDLDDKEFIHAALRDDVEAIRRYGEANPETWTGVRFENEPRVRVIASFTGDLGRHEAALRGLLAYPDRLVLEHARWTRAKLDLVASEIRSTLRQRQDETGRRVMASLGVGTGVVSVGLQADQEDLAKELLARYEDAIELEVGAFSYPMGRARARPRPQPGPEPEIIEIDGLELRLRPERRVFEMGDHGRADLVVRNVGSHHLGPLYSGRPLLALLVDDAGRVVGGSAPALVAGTGLGIDLDPGAELSVDVLFGTASYREELGYLVPAGRYWLRTYLWLSEGDPPRSEQRAMSPPLEEVTIVSRRRRSERGEPPHLLGRWPNYSI